MIRKRILLGMLLLVLGATGIVPPLISSAEAQQGLRDPRPRDDNRIEAGGYSLDQAVALAQRRYKAKVVKAETAADRGRRVHIIRLYAEGRVWTVRVDAETGRMQ